MPSIDYLTPKSNSLQDQLDQLVEDYGVDFPCKLNFAVAPVEDYDKFNKEVYSMIKPYKGTTTLSFVFDGGVIIAVDSRASAGGYVASQSVNKVLTINKFMLGTMAGGAADCQFWQRFTSMQCRLFELNNGRRISVRAASKILQNQMLAYKGMGISLGSQIAGYDSEGPSIFYVDNDGQRTKGQLFSVGSGSTYAYGILDKLYRKNLTDKEAQELGRLAIYHAGFRDAASGGTSNVYHINEDGWKKISSDDISDLHYLYYGKIQHPITVNKLEEEQPAQQ